VYLECRTPRVPRRGSTISIRVKFPTLIYAYMAVDQIIRAKPEWRVEWASDASSRPLLGYFEETLFLGNLNPRSSSQESKCPL